MRKRPDAWWDHPGFVVAACAGLYLIFRPAALWVVTILMGAFLFALIVGVGYMIVQELRRMLKGKPEGMDWDTRK